MALFAALSACAGGEDEPPGVYGETCDAANPCIAGLECVVGVCTTHCSNAATCQMLGTGDTCSGGACYSSCQDQFNCLSGLTCRMFGSPMGTCRP